jgi:hypothetical protein
MSLNSLNYMFSLHGIKWKGHIMLLINFLSLLRVETIIQCSKIHLLLLNTASFLHCSNIRLADWHKIGIWKSHALGICFSTFALCPQQTAISVSLSTDVFAVQRPWNWFTVKLELSWPLKLGTKLFDGFWWSQNDVSEWRELTWESDQLRPAVWWKE